MKKIVLLMFVVCAALTANAQVYVGGSVGFWHNDDADATSYKIIPEIGYNLSDKWALGMEIGYYHAEDGIFNGEIMPETNFFSVAPYARFIYYENGIVRLFLDGGFGFGTYKIKDLGDSENGFEIGIKPGIAVKLNDRFSLISKIGFLGYRDEYITANLQGGNGFGLDFSPANISFGVQVNF